MTKFTKFLFDKNLDMIIRRSSKSLGIISFKEQLNLAETALILSDYDYIIDPNSSKDRDVTCRGYEEWEELTLVKSNINYERSYVKNIEIPLCEGREWLKDDHIVYLCQHRDYKNLLIFTNLPDAYKNDEAEKYMCIKLNGKNFSPMLLPELLKMYKEKKL